jgi:ankyrin repeat protein
MAKVRLAGILGLAFGLDSLVVAVPARPTSPPVADAAMRGDREAVRRLLQQGADVGAAHGDGMTPLHWAAERGDAELAEMLVYAGASVGALTRIGQYTPLHLASRAGSGPVVQTLLKAGAAPDTRTSTTGVTALHLGAASGTADVVKLLLEAGADPNAREAEWGQTPLMFAAAANRVDAIRLLLARGADPRITTRTLDLTKEQALDRAATARQRKVLEASVPKGQRPTPSQVQAAIQAAREIFASGQVPPPDPRETVDPNAPTAANSFNPEEINPPVATKGGLTALLHAARQGHLDAARALVDGGAPIDQVGAGDETSPLLMATINGQFDLALFLIERGANPNLAARGNGATPLWAAVNTQWQPRTRFPQPQEMGQQKATYLDVMKALLEAGADPNARLRSHPWYLVYSGCGNRNCGLADNAGSTAFWRAAYATDVDAMRLLVSYGADVNIPTIAPQQRIRRGPEAAAPAGGAPGGPAAPVPGAGGPIAPVPAANQERYAAPLIPYGGPAAFPIHAAAGVEYGEGFAGNAHRHAPDGWLPAVKYLVEELGADVNARDNDGYTPLHHAAARGDNEMILYLVSKGADVTAVARSGQTTADMANGPVQRVSPFPATVALLEKLGSKNSHRCVSC